MGSGAKYEMHLPSNKFSDLMAKYLAKRLDAHIIYVSGLRRSGHHAVINWLIACFTDNAEGVKYPTDRKWFRVSEDNKVAHINAVDYQNPRKLYQALGVLKNDACTVNTLIVSSEDCSAMNPHWFSTLAAAEIYVTRGLLNNMASRIQYMVNSSLKGSRGNTSTRVDAEFFKNWIEHRTVQSNDTRLRVDYDLWCINDAYREELAGKLAVPINGNHAIQTDNEFAYCSSFGSAIPTDPRAYLTRYKEISWHPRLIEKVLSNNSLSEFITSDELSYLNSQANKLLIAA